MAHTRLVAAVAVFFAVAAASIASCTTSNPGFTPPANTSSGNAGGSGSASGNTSGSGPASGSAASGGSGATSGGSAATGASGGIDFCASANCQAPTRYVDPHRNPNDGGAACVCAGNAYSTTTCGTCTCQDTTPLLCVYDAGQPPQCVDKSIDPNNCGGCGIVCKPKAACNAGTCGMEPSPFVPAAPGCIAMRIVIENGIMYWADMGHGTIKSKSLAAGPGGAVTTIASGIHIAAEQSAGGPELWPVLPYATTLLVHNGTVYWVGSADTVAPLDDAGNWQGGVGTTIMSASAGTAPKTLLTSAMAPGPSPVSATDAQFSLEQPGKNPAILAMAFSPNFSTIYFSAGTRFYSLPVAGGAPTYVGYTQGPEHGIATALTADGTYLYYPADSSANVEINKLGTFCNQDAGVWTMALGSADGEPVCPVRIARSQSPIVLDNIVVSGNSLYWGKGNTVIRGDVNLAITGSAGGGNYPSTLGSNSVTSFAIGTQYAYFAEDGFIEKGLSPSISDGSNPNAIVVARQQPQPSQIALDGTNVYWATSRCDINTIPDSPQ